MRTRCDEAFPPVTMPRGTRHVFMYALDGMRCCLGREGNIPCVHLVLIQGPRVTVRASKRL